ncbi:AraC family transcriptional regulator [Amycolatopsis sp. 195334CR]|uniref:helix-turn-helix domain-containing protein n=1 Tax=Amycolatopsis sp. 195334CR TaxID=2814588 RepID=UPI001A8CA5C0|nr:helix-turn-helix transcriptional regulator [Amycolatopsis sp. 195334CR]MBN6033800.1 helix-turn-helix transcriptional regulator [Amycolatopsis sp. 195334CR]
MGDWALVVPTEEVDRLDGGHVFASPHPRLAAHVLSYTAQDYRQHERRTWRMTPLGVLTLSIDFEAPVRRLESGVDLPASAVIGLRDRPLVAEELPGRSCGISIGLTPLGAYALFGLPLREIANSVVGLADLLGTRGDLLVEELAETRGWAARFRLLDERFTAWLGAELEAPVLGAWQRLQHTGGRLRVDRLAEEIGWTRQHLNRRFREQIGLSLKATARVARLNRAAVLMNGPHALAEIAAITGYADQAHLNRDFRALTGCTPTEYRRKQ